MGSPSLGSREPLPIRIRPMYREELKDVLSLIHHSIQKMNAKNYSPHQLKKIVDAYHRSVLRSGTVIVAEYQSQIVGVAKAHLKLFRTQFIEAVFTHPDFVGRGVGKAMLLELERLAKLRSVKRISVCASMTVAGFYQNLGYEPYGKTQTFEAVDCLFMEKRFKPRTLWDPLSDLLSIFLVITIIFVALYGLASLAFYLLIHGV